MSSYLEYFRFIFGVKNYADGKKIIVCAENTLDLWSPELERQRALSTLSGRESTAIRVRPTEQTAIHAGAHEVYLWEAPVGAPRPGVGELLPAGSKLLAWGLNGASYTTTRPDGRPGPLLSTWPG